MCVNEHSGQFTGKTVVLQRCESLCLDSSVSFSLHGHLGKFKPEIWSGYKRYRTPIAHAHVVAKVTPLPQIDVGFPKRIGLKIAHVGPKAQFYVNRKFCQFTIRWKQGVKSLCNALSFVAEMSVKRKGVISGCLSKNCCVKCECQWGGASSKIYGGGSIISTPPTSLPLLNIPVVVQLSITINFGENLLNLQASFP